MNNSAMGMSLVMQGGGLNGNNYNDGS